MMEVKTLDSLCLKITDGAHHSPKEFQGGIPMFSVKDMTDHGFDKSSVKTISKEDYKKLKSSGCEPKDNDVLIAKDGSVMKHVFKYKHYEDCALLSSIAILRPNMEIIDPDYLVYSILNPKVKGNIISNYVSGSGVPRIVLKDFKKIEIKVPEIRIQKKVSQFLNQINSKIELNQQMNKTLEDIAKTLFKSWFIDFDPVRAKAEGRPTGLSKEISDLFPDSFEDSELGEMPRGWRIESLSKITSFKNGFAFKSKDWTESGKPVVKIRNVKPLILDIEGCSFISDDLKKYDEYLLSKGDILIGMTGYVGETCLVPKLKKMPYQNQRVGKLIPTKGFFKEFLFSFTRQSSFKRKVEEIAQGSAQQNVSGRDILELDFVFGNEEILKMFSDSTSDIFKKILSNFEENIILTELRDTLLPKLVSGDLKIPDAENLVKEAGI